MLIIILGNLTTTATNNYSSTLANSQQSTSERISFENVVYTNSGNSGTLKVYIMNCGSANNIQIGSVFLYFTSNNTLVGPPNQSNEVKSSGGSLVFPLFKIDSGASIQSNSLNRGNEGYFTVLSGILQYGTPYTIHVITQSGSSFDYEFTP